MQPAIGKKDPIKDDPLPLPGESLQQQIEEFKDENMIAWFFLAVLAIFTAIVEWLQWALNSAPHPFLFSAIAVAVVVLAVVKIRGALQILRPLQLGLRGERAVGQFLEAELRPHGYAVSHDLIGDGFNVDHVIIGPSGVYTVDTKTISKPRGDARVVYNGQNVRVAGFTPDRDPIIQARAAASFVAEKLREYSGISISARPVVLYPGWFIEKQPRGVEVWVLNQKSLIDFVLADEARIDPREVTVLRGALERISRDAKGHK